VIDQLEFGFIADGPRMLRAALRSLNMSAKALSPVLGPVLALVVRIWLAQIFLLAAAMQFAAPGKAAPLNLYACFDGMLESGSPAKTAVVLIAVLLSSLLALGWQSRISAFGLAAIALLGFFLEGGQGQNLLWALMLLYIGLFGPGSISLDSIFSQGRFEMPGWLLGLQRGFLAGLRWWLVLVIAVGVWGPSGIGDTANWLAPRSMVFGYFEPSLHTVLAILALGFVGPGFLVRPAAGLAAPILALTGLQTGGVETLYLAALMGFVASSGPGWMALERWCKLDQWPSHSLGKDQDVPHIVVIGAGFGGLAAIGRLAREQCRITLIDRRNHHLFQPLLYQVATAALSPGDIALPIRALVRDQKNITVIMGEVTGIDRQARQVELQGRRISYDQLIVATGAKPGYFGKEQWANVAPALKQVEDATHIRSRLLAAFEHAEDAVTQAERDAWMSFVIVGAGPTGVEMAGALAELAHEGLHGEFRRIDPAKARIFLLNRGPRCLSAFPEACSAATETMLRRLGVEVRYGAQISTMDTDGVVLADGSRIASKTTLWTAGVQASAAASWLGIAPGPGGRVPVNARLQLPGDEHVFVIGDTAAIKSTDGALVPGLAPAAKQAGQYVAKVIAAGLKETRPPSNFIYRDQGSLATIGRAAAIADFGWIRLSGLPAWWLWGLVHVGFLTGVRNRIAVGLQWFWAYLTWHRSTRLITLAPNRSSAAAKPPSDRGQTSSATLTKTKV
jgi:NADH dehydrogenase/putative oxidoreductase